MILFHEMLENLSGHPDSLVDRALPRPAERPMGTERRRAHCSLEGPIIRGAHNYMRRE